MLLSNFLLFASAAHAGLIGRSSDVETPSPPGLTFLYSSNVTLTGERIDYGQTPFSHRVAIPITGGTFSGPRMKGTFLNQGADWGQTDKDGLFHPDTRYDLLTDDGANIFIRTDGPSQSDGTTHLRIRFETGHADYYWLNNIVAIGILHSPGDVDYVLIDAWQIESPSPRDSSV